MKQLLIALSLCLVLSLTGCEKRSAPPAGDSSSEQSSSDIGSQSSSSEGELDADSGEAEMVNSYIEQNYDEEFLAQAYAMGYDNEKLYTLGQNEFTRDEILNPALRSDYTETTTEDGRYSFASFGAEYITSFWAVTDNDTGHRYILNNYNNGWCSGQMLDNERFYLSLAQVGGSNSPAGVYFYRFENPNEPIAGWMLTDIPMDEQTETVYSLLNSYYHQPSGILLALHCEYPRSWGGWVPDGDTSRNYSITAMDNQGQVLFTVDTGINLRSGKMGIASFDFEKPNALLEPTADVIYFDDYNFGEGRYGLNYKTQQITKLS